MEIYEVERIIEEIADGFEEACLRCMHTNPDVFVDIVEDQLYSGIDGDGKNLSPTYDNDPYFERVRWFRWEDGVMYHGAEGYKQWKKKITPPETSRMIGLPPRPVEVPNLFIDGTFYSTIKANSVSDGVEVKGEGETSDEIERKYGEQIFGISDKSAGWYNEHIMLPAIGEFFEKCGYR